MSQVMDLRAFIGEYYQSIENQNPEQFSRFYDRTANMAISASSPQIMGQIIEDQVKARKFSNIKYEDNYLVEDIKFEGADEYKQITVTGTMEYGGKKQFTHIFTITPEQNIIREDLLRIFDEGDFVIQPESSRSTSPMLESSSPSLLSSLETSSFPLSAIDQILNTLKQISKITRSDEFLTEIT